MGTFTNSDGSECYFSKALVLGGAQGLSCQLNNGRSIPPFNLRFQTGKLEAVIIVIDFIYSFF